MSYQDDEIWKDIIGFENKYKISNHGNVLIKNYKRSGFDKLASIKPNKDGYIRVYLNVGYTKAYLVHRLVAFHFLKEPLFKEQNQVNHIDGNKDNNHYKNLEWVTCRQNISHAKKNGLWSHFGDNHINSKINSSDIPTIIKMLKTKKISQAKIAYIFDVTPMVISNICNKKAWGHLW